MTKENKKYYLTSLLWLAYGYFCWLAAVYLFAFGASNLVTPVSEYMKTVHHGQLLTLTHFALFYFGDFSLILAFTFILSLATGKKLLWLIFFLIGKLSQSLYESLRSIIFYKNYYDNLPSWVTSYVMQEIIAYLFVTPLIAWIGIVLGNKYRTIKKPA